MKKLNNRGFLLVETIVVSAFALTVLIILFVQFKNLINNYNLSYKFNTVEGVYNLNTIKTYLDENQSSETQLNSLLKSETTKNYLEIIKNGSCTVNSLGLALGDFCDKLAQAGNFKTVIYTNSDVTALKGYVLKINPNSVISENMKTFIRRIDKETSKNRLIAEYKDGSFATITYGVNNDNLTSFIEPENPFSTDGYGIPTNDLLFWGDVNNSSNTTSILKNKVSGDDGRLTNFNNNASSGFNNGELIFDGTNDYVNISLASHDFSGGVSYVIYASIDNSSKNELDFFGNWEAAGGGLGMTSDNKFYVNGYDGSNYIGTNSDTFISNRYYTIIGTYDGTNLKMYVDGALISFKALSKMTTSSMPIYIGGNPNPNGFDMAAKMRMKEAMVYDRALSEDEVKQIANNFNKKYKS